MWPAEASHNKERGGAGATGNGGQAQIKKRWRGRGGVGGGGTNKHKTVEAKVFTVEWISSNRGGVEWTVTVFSS